MRLIDAARRLVEPYATLVSLKLDGEIVWECAACHAVGRSHASLIHGSDCPMLSMPRIVAVIEAAERFVEITADYPPAAYDEYLALVAALKESQA